MRFLGGGGTSESITVPSLQQSEHLSFAQEKALQCGQTLLNLPQSLQLKYCSGKFVVSVKRAEFSDPFPTCLAILSITMASSLSACNCNRSSQFLCSWAILSASASRLCCLFSESNFRFASRIDLSWSEFRFINILLAAVALLAKVDFLFLGGTVCW